MTPGDEAPTPDPTPAPPGSPTPADVLRWCAAADPAPWFPSDHARQTGVPRDALDDPLWSLVRAGLVHVADWARGRGQGFALTPAGREALTDPRRLPDPGGHLPAPPPPVAPPSPVPAPPARRDRNPADDLPTTAYDRGEAARAAFYSPPTAVVAPALLAATVVWFIAGLGLAERTGGDIREYFRGQNVGVVVREGAVVGPALLDGEWWRLASSMFVHFGLLHLALNMVAVGVLGPLAEGLWGRGRFALLYVLAGVGGACAAAAVNPLGAVAGASGAVWGMMFAVVAWLLLYRQHLPPQAVIPWTRQLLYAVTLNAAVSLLPGVSWAGHLGGGAVGFAAAVLLDLVRPDRGWKRPVVGVAGLLVLAAVVTGGLWAAMRYTEEWQFVRGFGHVVRLATGELPQLRTLPAEYGPERVNALHGSAAAALVSRQPGAIQNAREMADRLSKQAVILAHLTADDGRMYAAEVQRYVEILRPLLDAGQPPSPDQARGLVDQLRRVEQSWPAAAGK